MLRIPVCMHNVPDDQIFRPAAWNAFGTKDPEGCSASRARELPALGIRGSAWCSVHVADVEDPECLQRIQGRRVARSRGSVGSAGL